MGSSCTKDSTKEPEKRADNIDTTTGSNKKDGGHDHHQRTDGDGEKNDHDGEKADGDAGNNEGEHHVGEGGDGDGAGNGNHPKEDTAAN